MDTVLKATFTPGPWTLCEGNGIAPCPCGFIWDASEEIHVASAHGPEDLDQSWFGGDVAVSEEEQQANGRLIASAPELLAALKAMVACCTDAEGAISPEPEDRGVWLDNMMAAYAAIAKAEGHL